MIGSDIYHFNNPRISTPNGGTVKRIPKRIGVVTSAIIVKINYDFCNDLNAKHSPAKASADNMNTNETKMLYNKILLCNGVPKSVTT